MLCKFSVKNFKSFRDWFDFDLTKTKNYEFNNNCIKEGIVNKALIYGHNSVGKTNLALAIFDIVGHLTDKHTAETKYTSNYKYAEKHKELTEFNYQFKFDNNTVVYEYGKESYNTIIYEHLTINNQLVITYDRRNDNSFTTKISGLEQLIKDLKKVEISVLKYIKSNTVFEDNNETYVLSNFFRFVDNMLLFWSLDNRSYIGYEVGSKSIFPDLVENNHFDDFLEFLKDAGLEHNLTYRKEDNELKVLYKFGENYVEFFEGCSTGMRAILLLYYWLQKIKVKTSPPLFVFIDEFDAFYHFALAQTLVKEFKDNTNIQLVLTTHNPSLMSNDLVRPDCCFLMYNDRIHSLAELTGKELRVAHNIEKMYRAGVFNGK